MEDEKDKNSIAACSCIQASFFSILEYMADKISISI